MTDRLTPEREAEIAEHLATTTNWSIGNLAARDLLAEVQRLKAALSDAADQVAELESDLGVACARVAELERPAIEAKRREIRSSYVESIAMAQEDRDYESAFNIECQLREREEQWKREDGEVA